MRSLIIFLPFLWTIACATPGETPDKGKILTLENATVVSLEKPTFTSGYMASCAVMRVKPTNQKTYDIHISFMRQDQAFPPIGAKCSIKARIDDFCETSGVGPVPSHPVPLAMDVTCDNQAYYVDMYEPNK